MIDLFERGPRRREVLLAKLRRAQPHWRARAHRPSRGRAVAVLMGPSDEALAENAALMAAIHARLRGEVG